MLMSKSRLEKFLYALYSLDSSDLPTPLSRIEELYKCLVTGEEAPSFEPISRTEKYLMAILGVYDVNELPNPISRVEVLLYKLATGDDNLDDIKSFLSEHEELLAEIIRNGGVGGNIDIEYVLYTLSTKNNTLYNTIERPIKSVILKGNTDENLQSVKMPVLKTIGKNLFDVSKATNGYVGSSGVINTSNVSNVKSDYIPIKPNTTYSFIAINSSQANSYFSWFTDDKTFISRHDKTQISTSPSNASFLMIHNQYGDKVLDSFNGMLTESDIILEEYEPYKSTTITVNEDVTLRSNGDVCDELNLLIGRLTQRIDENNEVLSQEMVKTVDLSVINQDGNNTKLSTFNDITHVTLSSEGLIPEAELEVATKNEEDLEDSSVYVTRTLSEEFNTLYNTAKKPVKSAILKGNTLVNINRPITRNDNMKVENGLQILTTWTTAYNLWMVNDITLFKPNTKYYIIAEVIDNTLTSTWSPMIGSIDCVFSGSISSLNFVSKETGIKCATFTTKSDFTNVIYGLRSATGTNETVGSILKFRIAIIEYQDGMENWDIPYFDGMQSVKMPVLTTVGKNLYNPDRAYASGSGGRDVYNDVDVKPNTEYTFYANNYSWTQVMLYNNKGQITRHFGNNSTSIKVTFTTTNDEVKARMIFYHGNGTVIKNVDFTDVQLEYGAVSTTYKPFKSNILTVNEDITLRSNGSVYDELDLLTGELTQRIDENGEVLSQEVVKTVDISTVDQDGDNTKLSTFDDITHVTLSSEGLIPEAELEVAEKVPEVAANMLGISREQEVINTATNEQSENVDSTMIATTEIYEELL